LLGLIARAFVIARRDRMMPICGNGCARRRFGYRRLHILLRRGGVLVSRKKTQRLYTEEGLTMR
jgi:hypothetical protein